MARHKQVNMSADFQLWLESMTEHYLSLKDEEKNLTMDQLIAASGPAQLTHLCKQVDVLLYRDFLRLLPPEVREYLLTFLDGKSLLTCCCVSRFWNRSITYSSRAWLLACRRAGFIIDSDVDNCDESYWKFFFLDMTRRCHQMQNYASFKHLTFGKDLRRITAVHYYNGKVASASDSKTIKIWDCATQNCVLSLRTDASISTIKFDDQYLIAASYLGHMVLWDVFTGERLMEFMRHTGPIFSFDFSLDLNVVVSGAADSKIKIWSLLDAKLYKTITSHKFWVLKVLLTPYPVEQGSKHRASHLLISTDWSCISVRLMSFLSVESKPHSLYLTTLYNIPLNKSDNLLAFTPGFFFDGTYLHFIKNMDGISTSSAVLCQWDVRKRKMSKEVELKQRVKSLLAVGRKYIALLMPWHSKATSTANFIVLDRDTHERAALWHLSPHRQSSPECGHFSFGETSWLDGLDGKNDSGVVVAYGAEDNSTYALQWLSRQTKLT